MEELDNSISQAEEERQGPLSSEGYGRNVRTTKVGIGRET